MSLAQQLLSPSDGEDKSFSESVLFDGDVYCELNISSKQGNGQLAVRAAVVPLEAEGTVQSSGKLCNLGDSL